MATRSRLGRDPLRGVSQPEGTKKPARTTTKPKPAPKAAAKRQSTKQVADTAAQLSTTTDTSPESPSEASIASPRAAAPLDTDGVAQPPIAPDKPQETASPVEAAPAEVTTSVTPTAPVTASPQVEATPPMTDEPVAASPGTPPSPDMHPVAVFLRGVLDGLGQDTTVHVSVTVESSAYALPVEKLFYFSHAIQLVISPLEWPGNAWKRPVVTREPFPSLTAKLEAYQGGTKHVLRLYDNGLFFSSYYPEMHLGMEPLRPLMLFVIQRSGSITLKQGRAVEFEIIG